MRRSRGCTCTEYRPASDACAAKAALAVASLVGEEAARGLSANVVSRLKRVWGEEYQQWCRRPLEDDWVYVWADGPIGVHLDSALRLSNEPGPPQRPCPSTALSVELSRRWWFPVVRRTPKA